MKVKQYDFDEVFARYSREITILKEICSCALEGCVLTVLEKAEKGEELFTASEYDDKEDEENTGYIAFMVAIKWGFQDYGYITEEGSLTEKGKKSLALFREYDAAWKQEYGHTRFVSDDDTI